MAHHYNCQIKKMLPRYFSLSSKSWLRRHNKGAFANIWLCQTFYAIIVLDAFVKMAAGTDLRSRAAFKLTEIQDRYKIISPADIVVGRFRHTIFASNNIISLQILVQHLADGPWPQAK